MSQHRVSIREGTSEFAAYIPSAQNLTKRPQWQFILDAVFQNRCRRTIWLKKVLLLEFDEGTFELPVIELLALDIIEMLGHPASPKWSEDRRTNDGARAVRDALGRVQYFELVEWRVQT